MAPMSSLSIQLFREAPPEFFGVLVSRNGPFYLDALDALERALLQCGLKRRSDLGLRAGLVLVHRNPPEHETKRSEQINRAGDWDEFL